MRDIDVFKITLYCVDFCCNVNNEPTKIEKLLGYFNVVIECCSLLILFDILCCMLAARTFMNGRYVGDL